MRSIAAAVESDTEVVSSKPPKRLRKKNKKNALVDDPNFEPFEVSEDCSEISLQPVSEEEVDGVFEAELTENVASQEILVIQEDECIEEESESEKLLAFITGQQPISDNADKEESVQVPSQGGAIFDIIIERARSFSSASYIQYA